MTAGFMQDVGYALRALVEPPAVRAGVDRRARRSRSARTRPCSASSTACSCGRCRTPTATGSSWSTTRIRRSTCRTRARRSPTTSSAASRRRRSRVSRSSRRRRGRWCREGAPQRLLVARASRVAVRRPARCARSLAARSPRTRPCSATIASCILSHRLWSTQFGARADIVGSDIRLRRQLVPRHRRDARGLRVPATRRRCVRAVRVHAASK